MFGFLTGCYFAGIICTIGTIIFWKMNKCELTCLIANRQNPLGGFRRIGEKENMVFEEQIQITSTLWRSSPASLKLIEDHFLRIPVVRNLWTNSAIRSDKKHVNVNLSTMEFYSFRIYFQYSWRLRYNNEQLLVTFSKN